MTARKLRVAINPRLKNKNATGETDLFVHGWENVELTPLEMADKIARGIAYTAQLKGKRKGANFLASDVVSVDIDRGMTIEQALSHPLVAEHAAFIYTTASHTEQAPRFRVVFDVSRTIADASEMRAVQRSLALRLNGDPSATDPARIFYGNSDAKVIMIGMVMTELMLAELIAQSQNALNGGPGGLLATTRSALPMAADQPIRLADGRVVPFSKTSPKMQVHCPYHNDEHASAFIVLSRNGGPGVHCSACQATYWLCGEHDAVDFHGFDRTVRQLIERVDRHRDFGPFGPFFNGPDTISGLLGCTIEIVDTAGPTKLLRGITFVKAPKGAGKTATVAELIADSSSVLLIGHRRSLIRQSCKRLGLACYLDVRCIDIVRPRLGICFDLLNRIGFGKRYDVVILDEVEQVLAHVLSDTVEQRSGGGRARLFRQLQQLVFRAKRVVALDADLGWTSFNILTRIKGCTPAAAAQGDLFDPDRNAVRIVMNESKPGLDKVVEIYRSKSHLVADMMAAAKDGKRLFIASNSRALIHKLASAMDEKLPGTRKIAITSETVSNRAQRAFLELPATEALKYDAIFTSPALGTGVDITFPDRAALIDVVFGFCEADITTHWDCDQHIGRVRQPGAVKVWLSPKRLSYETHPDVVRRELWESSLYKHVMIDTNGPNGTPRYAEDDPLIELAAQVISQQRASKNALRQNFIAHKQDQGFSIRFVGENAELRAEGRGLLRIGEEAGIASQSERMMNAPPLDWHTYWRVKITAEAGAVVPEDLWLSYLRTRLELFYRRHVGSELIALDARGRYRRCVTTFQGLELRAGMPSCKGADRPREATFLRDRDERFKIIESLVRRSGLLGPAGFNAQAIIDGDILTDFVVFASENKGAIETQLGIEVRRDLKAKPIVQLKAVLRLIGLDIVSAGTVKKGDRKIYRYRIDAEKLQQARAVVADRSKERAWDALARLHGWPTTADYDGDYGDDAD